MTALRQFARLETTGLWRPAPEAQRREVVVSFGEATVMIADGSGRPLTHWSLPALLRLNPGEMPARYAPDAEGSEELELDDTLMVEAIEKVRAAIARAQPRPGLLRRGGGWIAGAALAGLAVLWLPGALTRQTLALVPESTRVEIGATMLGLMQRDTGPACRAPQGTAALERLAARLFGAGSGIAIVVLPDGPPGVVRLPGGLIVVPRDTVAATDDPFVLAGHVVATAATAAVADDPLRPILEAAGLRATLTLLATGALPPAALEPLAASLLEDPQPAAPTDALLDAFARAGLPVTPWAYATDPTGESVLALIEADPLAGQDPAPVMSDADWVSLQGICGG